MSMENLGFSGIFLLLGKVQNQGIFMGFYWHSENLKNIFFFDNFAFIESNWQSADEPSCVNFL